MTARRAYPGERLAGRALPEDRGGPGGGGRRRWTAAGRDGGGLQRAAEEALKASGKFIPWQVVTLSAGGEILDR